MKSTYLNLADDSTRMLDVFLFLQGMQQYYRGEFDSAKMTNKIAQVWATCGFVTGVVCIISVMFVGIVAITVRTMYHCISVLELPTV